MKNVKQPVSRHPLKESLPAGSKVVCNYKDNYYGDQQCVDIKASERSKLK